MNPAPAFDRAYGVLKRRIMGGEWRPGQRIDLASLADQLGASITPVRDAMNRLVGERLLTTGISEGFAIPAMTEPELRDLYAWNLDVLMGALRTRQRAHSEAFVADTPQDLASRAGAIFHMIAGRAQNKEYAVAIAGLNDRLHVVRLAEAHFVRNVEADVAQLEHDLRNSSVVTMRKSLIAYHRKRIRGAGEIVYALHRSE